MKVQFYFKTAATPMIKITLHPMKFDFKAKFKSQDLSWVMEALRFLCSRYFKLGMATKCHSKE